MSGKILNMEHYKIKLKEGSLSSLGANFVLLTMIVTRRFDG